jgi:uncharacterized membrane protein YkoI
MKHAVRFVLVPLPLLLSVALGAMNDSKPVTLQQAPPAVQKTIALQTGSGSVEEIDQSLEDGVVTYDVTYLDKQGEDRGFSVRDSGALLSVEQSLTDVSPAVQKTIQTQAAGWELDGIDKNMDGTFDVKVINSGTERSFTVADDGTLLSEQVALADTPPAVQQIINAHLNGWQLDGIDRNTDDGQITYDVEVTNATRDKTFTLAEDGTLMSTEVTLDEVPVVPRATILRVVATGHVTSIDENVDPAGDTFDVLAEAPDGSTKSFTVGIYGAERSEQVTLAQTPPKAAATIRLTVGAGRILRIDHSLVEKKLGVFPYQVMAWKDGKPLNFSVGPGGRFLGVDE